MVTRFVYDASGNLLAEADASGTIQRYYIHGVGLMALVTASGELYVYHHDRTGHTVALTDAQAAVVNRYAYSPYGRVLAREEAIAQPFTFVGQYGVMDEGEGFYYMRARYYDTQSGRFISEDPAGFVDGPNLYAYVGGNPVAAVDPYGLSAERRNPPVASSPGSVLTPPVSGAVSPKLGVPPRGALDTEGDYRLLTGEPKCDGFSAGCQSGGSFGYPAVVRISGKNLCRDCAIKFLGIENLARPEQREILQPFEPNKVIGSVSRMDNANYYEATAKLRPGDLFHATGSCRGAYVCRCVDIDDVVVHAYAITTLDHYCFARETGRAPQREGEYCLVDSVASLPDSVVKTLTELEHRYAAPLTPVELENGRPLRREEIDALLLAGRIFRDHPIAGGA